MTGKKLHALKRTAFVGLIFMMGCGNDLFAPFIVAPAETDVVIGGISNLQPFFGTLQCSPESKTDNGVFLLASCGCGDWRVLFKPKNGGKQVQFPILFYSDGAYSPTGEVAVYGVDGDKGFSGRVNQEAGTVSGKGMNGFFRTYASAARTDAHSQPVEACVLCHVGEDPIYPLPDTHPQDYKTNPNVCLNCHSANGI